MSECILLYTSCDEKTIEYSMVDKKRKQLSKEDWIRGALEILDTTGVQGLKIVILAEQLGVTSGSYYWHFKNRRELLDALLEYWELEMTNAAKKAALLFEGTPKERIWNLMEQVMTLGMANYDLAIWHWAQSDSGAKKVFMRALDTRFTFAKWMFQEAGFSEIEAEARGRLMVVYMMGESTLISDSPSKRKEQLRVKFEILVN
jgi:AcrR family transcriptional regulator